MKTNRTNTRKINKLISTIIENISWLHSYKNEDGSIIVSTRLDNEDELLRQLSHSMNVSLSDIYDCFIICRSPDDIDVYEHMRYQVSSKIKRLLID